MQYPFSERMKKVKRVIIHSDINNCYASIERQLNPSLVGKPIAVCGAAEERHGIVLAKSYEAKAFGVQTGEAIWQAKNKCHNLIIVSPHYDKYVQYSRLAHEIYKKYTPLIEPYGLDECWLDVSGSVELFGSGEEIAAEIHRRFKEELGLTVSCGVASNKIFAKLGSDMKKPDATTVIPEEGFQELVWPLPVSDLWGVGRQTTKKLDSYCINTIGALAKTNLQFLQERFGVAGTQLWLYANGRDTSRVARYGYIAPIKSIGHGATTAKDMESDEEVWRTILDLTQEIGYKLKKNHLAARGIQLIDLAIERVRTFYKRGDLYAELLSKNYLTGVVYRVDEIIESLGLERSVYYNRRQEAVLLFGYACKKSRPRNNARLPASLRRFSVSGVQHSRISQRIRRSERNSLL